MTARTSAAFRVLCGVTLVAGCLACGQVTAQAAGLDRIELSERARLAAAYLSRAQQADGTFAYEYDFALGRYRDRDSIVRQAGAVFGLADYLGHDGDGPVRDAVVRGLDMLAARSIAYGDGQLVSGDGTLASAATGATAIALLAELSFFRATGNDRFASIRRAWLAGLAALQLPAGRFAERPDVATESDYFNGETWLALARYVRRFPDDLTAREMLARADEAMIARYTRTPELFFFHWGTMAAATRFATTREARFLDFVSMQGWLFVFALADDLSPDGNSCAAVEGLADGARALLAGGRASDPGYAPIAAQAERRLATALSMQIVPGAAMSVDISDGDRERFAGAFLNGLDSPRTRIDATQHCLSAILKYRAWLDAGGTDP